MATKALVELWDPKKAIKVMENVSSTRTPVKSILFPTGGVPINSYVLPASYVNDTLDNVPMVYASNQPEPIAITSVDPKNYDIGSFFVVKNYTKREHDQMVLLLNSNNAAETQRSMQNVTNHRDRYIENMLGSGLSGKAVMQTRDSNGALVDYEVTYGTVAAETRSGASWASASLAVMLEDAHLIKTKMEAGFGDIDIPNDELIYFCSSAAFKYIYAQRNTKQRNDVIQVESGTIEGFRYIEVDGYKFVDVAGKYRLPDGSTEKGVADNWIQAVWNNPAVGHGLYYLAIDNFEVTGSFMALPLISYIVDGAFKKYVSQLWESRPIVLYNSKAMVKMLVIS